MSETPPTFVPSEATVTEAAKRIGKRIDSHLEWDKERPHVRAFYRQTALDALNAAGPLLVGDALAHLAAAIDAYDVPFAAEDLAETARQVRESAT